jgi:AbrB family looped-hinge helix DNA binding protein
VETVATTKMSSRGQVVIPESVRKELGLKPGSQFIVMGSRGVVILKAITPPSMAEFDNLIAEARKAGRRARLRRGDIRTAVASARGRR